MASRKSQQVKENPSNFYSLCVVFITLYGRKNSLLARRKLDRFPYLQYSTITISGPGGGGGTEALIVIYVREVRYEQQQQQKSFCMLDIVNVISNFLAQALLANAAMQPDR